MVDDRKVAFNWYLNRQGPRGPQGVKGDTGFSPNITVETDTLNEYILRITNEGGYFLTSNLREHKEDRGGTYIRYDRDNGVMYAGEADTATDAKAGIIKIATAEDVEAEDESTAVTPAILADYVARGGGASIDDTTVSSSKVWSSKKTSQSIAEVSNQVATNTTDISNIKTALPNKQNKLTAGANITIEGDVISATGGGAGDVTLAGDNSFTGNNTFDGVSTFNGDTWIDSLKVGTSLKNQQDKLFLNQSSITAGTNVSIEETVEGVKISATGGGGSVPTNMMTTDTTQMDLSGIKYWVSGAQLGIGSGLILDENSVSVAGRKLDITKQIVDGYAEIPVIHTSNPYIVLSARQKIKFQYDGSMGYYDILDSSHLGEYVDGTTITYTNNKLTAVGGGGSYTLPPATATTLGGIKVGDNLSITEDGTLSATGSSAPENMVTTDTAQTITGSKTFNGTITLKSAEIGNQISALQVPLYTSRTTKTLTPIVQSYTDLDKPVSEIRFGSINNKLKIMGSKVVDKNNKNFLTQGSVTAGSDNLLITNTLDGIEIICDAPTNAQIEALQRLINDLSTKIDNLTTRLNNLEEVIDGGIA